MSETTLDSSTPRAVSRWIDLPAAGGWIERYRLTGTPVEASAPEFTRVALSAAHVAVDPFANADPSGPPVLDWNRILAYRCNLTGLGLGVAEAMDIAQRGTGLERMRRFLAFYRV